MQRKLNSRYITAAALLVAIGIVIPMYSPIKFVAPPASFTLASHMAIFIAMAISPGIAVAVTLGTTLGFQLAGFPIEVVLRAASHLIFATLGALYLKDHPEVLPSPLKSRVFSFIVALVHGASEALVILWLFAGGKISLQNVSNGVAQYILVVIGLGSVIHSMVDFELSLIVMKALWKQKGLKTLFNVQT